MVALHETTEDKRHVKAKGRFERGEVAPARVWDVRPDGRGGFTRRTLHPKTFQRSQKAAWDKRILATLDPATVLKAAA